MSMKFDAQLQSLPADSGRFEAIRGTVYPVGMPRPSFAATVHDSGVGLSASSVMRLLSIGQVPALVRDAFA